VKPENERELLAGWFEDVRYVPVLDWRQVPDGYDSDEEADEDTTGEL